MANRFDQFDAQFDAQQNRNRFDQFDAPSPSVAEPSRSEAHKADLQSSTDNLFAAAKHYGFGLSRVESPGGTVRYTPFGDAGRIAAAEQDIRGYDQNWQADVDTNTAGGIRHLAQGATLGWADEAEAALTGRNVADIRQSMADHSENIGHGASTALQLVGGAPLAVATGGGGAAVNTLRGAAWQGAKVGAGTGAVYGAGAAEGGFGERAWGAAKGAAVGAAAGAALPIAAAPIVGGARLLAKPFLGRSGAYQKLASQMELDGSLATMGDHIAAGAQTAAHPIERRALDILGDEMLRSRNAASARTATADRLAAVFRITTTEAADHIAELEARQAASPLFLGEHPSIGPRDSMAAALQRGSHPTLRDHAAERFVRTPEETATSQVLDYLANSGGQAARRVRSGIAQRNAALPDEVEGALQRMQPPHMQPAAGPNADEAAAIGYRLGRARSGLPQADHLARYDAMAPDEQAVAQIGWIRAKIGALQDLPDGADAAKLLTNETTRQVAERLFGRQAVLELQRALTSVRVANQSSRRIGGSQTYQRGEMRRAMDGEINAVAAADSLSFGAVRKWLADMAAIAMRGRRNEHMADVVMTPMRDMPRVAEHLARLRNVRPIHDPWPARIGPAARGIGVMSGQMMSGQPRRERN